MFDIKCEAEQLPDGSFTLVITATGLDLDQAKVIADRMADPFRTICMDVITDGGRLKTEHRDLMRKPQ